MSELFLYDELRAALADALARAVSQGDLPPTGDAPIEIDLPPKTAPSGDYACGIALQLARNVGKPPMEVAKAITSNLDAPSVVKAADIAPPGFINLTVQPSRLQDNLVKIEREQAAYGDRRLPEPKRVQIEFVSVNPTGPLHAGHARGAALGSALAALLEKIGDDVEREYYINDAGTQIKRFGDSVYANYLKTLGVAAADDADADEIQYTGEFMDKLTQTIIDKFGDSLARKRATDAKAQIGEMALEYAVASIRDTLDRLGIRIDKWFSEKSLIQSGAFDKALDALRRDGYLIERDNALWFRTTEFGADDDDVVIRSGGGGHTYFGTDIAYHYDKIAADKRNFDLAIDIWGGDHHTHIARIKAALKALGCDADKLVVLVTQIVHFKSDKGVLKFSKRTGDVVTIDELLESVGKDACRYVFLSRSHSAQMVFDVDLVTKRSADNPVFYLQYAHARLSSILENAREGKLDYKNGDLSLLTHARELAVMKRLAEFPSALQRAAKNLEAHNLAFYSYELARSLQRFYEECRVISQDKADKELTFARLRLVAAARIVLKESLRLMGMSAPDKM